MADQTGSLGEEVALLRAENARLAQELATRLERFELVFTSSDTGMIITSFELGRFVEVNAAYAAYLGRSREEILAFDAYEFWLLITHREDFDHERRLVQSIVDGETNGYHVEKRFVRPDGEIVWGTATAFATRDERGRLKNLITYVRDLTEVRKRESDRVELESRLLQAQKLEAIGRLVGGVAHDFNNRLLVIMGYAELLKRGSAGNPQLEAHADLVLASSRRAADLTRQLLAYSRRQVLRPRPTDLNGVVDGMRRMLERVIGERVELVTVLGAKHPMLADPGQIEQVLMNLMLNACDAMPEGGRVTVETADIELAEAPNPADLPSGQYVALTVTDTGTGISEQVRAHLFEPFFTTKEVGKGSGLGLASVQGIVRQSGGGIAVRSGEGLGSTFVVYLPRATEELATAPPVAEPAARMVQLETVLVVDDEDDVRRLLVDVLRLGAYVVLEARDGEHALEIAQRHGGPIDLLVSDIVMPRLTGLELADRLRVRHPELKVLFMSGYAERESERERLRELSPNEQYIQKPFLPADLFRRANAILRATTAAPAVDRVG
jgi:two-component system, cell cycle sensor histidine kinase and response regulator CckA